MPAKIAYHVTEGEHVFPYSIDAESAVGAHPNEWSFTPWSKDGKKSEPIVEIPTDWQDMKPTERINLAIALTGSPRKGLTAAKADDIIAAEVDKRAAAEQPEPPAPQPQPKPAPAAPAANQP